MKTFIFADRSDKGLDPLTRETCAALLPVAGKAAIEYTIEELAKAGVREAVIVASAHADRIEAHLGGGERWGMAFDYFPGGGGEHPAQLVRRHGAGAGEPLLVIRGDMMRGSITDFVKEALERDEPLLEARVDGTPVGVALCRAGAAALRGLDWPFAGAPGTGAPAESITPAGLDWSSLASLADYHRANLDVAAGLYSGLKPAGWPREGGLTAGRGSQVAASSLQGDHAFVGRGARVHPEARLSGTCVIGDGCLVDRRALIRDSVVLPGTYVGEGVEIRHAIVSGDRIVRMDSGASVQVADPFLLAQMRGVGASLSTRVANRAAGLTLLALSLPLWPLAAASALSKSPSAPLRRIRLLGNKPLPGGEHESLRGEFTGLEWAAKAPILRRLPLLLAVVGGHINLVGAQPRPAKTAPVDPAPWEALAARSPAGLIGPVQLDLSPDAPAEEALLNEVYYAQHRSLRSDLGYLAKGLGAIFSSRAWTARGRVPNPC